MIHVRPLRSAPEVELTFVLDRPDVASAAVAVDVRGWTPAPMRRHPRGQGPWRLTLRVPSGDEVQFRYVLDGTWVDDPDADELRPNDAGSTNSVVRLRRG